MGHPIGKCGTAWALKVQCVRINLYLYTLSEYLMSGIFRIECQKCEQFMRYDREQFVKWDVMKWTCWKCGYEMTTSNLHDTIIHIGGEEK